MTRRRRTGKRIAGPLTIDELVLWQWDRDGLVEAFGSLAVAAEEWALRRHLFTEPPEAFWALDGPRHLRTPAAKALTGTAEDVVVAIDAFEERRRAWLTRQAVDWHEITATANGSTS